MKKKTVATSAPGKIIITGEHFVVHGSLAVAAAINRRAFVTISASEKSESRITSQGRAYPAIREDGSFLVIKSVLKRAFDEYGKPRTSFFLAVESNIPEGSGLGSSAAVSVATSAAISKFIGVKLSKEELWKLANHGEKSVHGNPSGIDTHASLSGGAFLFGRQAGQIMIRIPSPITFLVAFSGKRRRTSELVSKVGRVKTKYARSFEQFSRNASFLSRESAKALGNSDLESLGALMNLSQLSLSRIGVSTKELDFMIEILRSSDSLGAKITGAGGGGSVIALPKIGKAQEMLREISSRYHQSFLTSIPQEGLRWEK